MVTASTGKIVLVTAAPTNATLVLLFFGPQSLNKKDAAKVALGGRGFSPAPSYCTGCSLFFVLEICKLFCFLDAMACSAFWCNDHESSKGYQMQINHLPLWCISIKLILISTCSCRSKMMSTVFLLQHMWVAKQKTIL